jgi:hypothetical protein
MARVKYSKGNKKSPFFALVKGGDSLVASFCNPRKVVNTLRKNTRNRDKVFTVNSN